MFFRDFDVYYRYGDNDFMNKEAWKMVEAEMPFAEWLTNEYNLRYKSLVGNGDIDHKDIRQMVLLGMYEAACSYNPSKGKYTTYAAWRVQHCVVDKLFYKSGKCGLRVYKHIAKHGGLQALISRIEQRPYQDKFGKWHSPEAKTEIDEYAYGVISNKFEDPEKTPYEEEKKEFTEEVIDWLCKFEVQGILTKEEVDCFKYKILYDWSDHKVSELSGISGSLIKYYCEKVAYELRKVMSYE